MRTNAKERARLTTLLNAIDGGSPPPPDVVTWLRDEVLVKPKPRGRPPSPGVSLIRGGLIARLIQGGVPRHRAIEAIAGIDPNNYYELPPCSIGTADRHLDEFRHTWVPALRRLLVASQKTAINIDALTAIASAMMPINTDAISTAMLAINTDAIASAAAKLALIQRTEDQP